MAENDRRDYWVEPPEGVVVDGKPVAPAPPDEDEESAPANPR